MVSSEVIKLTNELSSDYLCMLVGIDNNHNQVFSFIISKEYLRISCCQVFEIVHVVFIHSYVLGGEHYCMFICDWPHTYIL